MFAFGRFGRILGGSWYQQTQKYETVSTASHTYKRKPHKLPVSAHTYRRIHRWIDGILPSRVIMILQDITWKSASHCFIKNYCLFGLTRSKISSIDSNRKRTSHMARHTYQESNAVCTIVIMHHHSIYLSTPLQGPHVILFSFMFAKMI